VNVSIRTVFVSVAVLVFCGAVSSQPQPNHPPLPGAAPPVAPPVPVVPRLDFFPPTALAPTSPSLVVPTPPAPPPEKTVDELLTELERMQAQKAELEKKEQELKATVRKKLEQQAERLKKLGVTPQQKASPDRIGVIVFEGNTKTPKETILEKLGLLPGQVLHYPALEEARVKLEKAGFRGVVVELIPDEGDSLWKSIRVKVDESKPEPAPAPRSPSGRG